MPRRHITPEQKDAAVSQYRAGANPNDIAEQLGIDRSSVYRFLEKRGERTKHRRVTGEDVAAMRDAVGLGESVRQVAERLGFTYSTVQRHTASVTRNDQPPPTLPPEPDAPRSWRDRAACRETDPATFFPEADDVAARRAAIRWCKVCPVRAECLRFAVDGREQGVWGGVFLGVHGGKRLRAAAERAVA